MTWVNEYANGLEFLANLDGVSWADAPVPHRRHQCVAQTRGSFGGSFAFKVVERCACGAIRQAGEPGWLERNSRRSSRSARRPWWKRWSL